MKLQYVFGNPRRLSHKEKRDKLKTGGQMKKPTAAQLRARKEFVKKFARKKRKNPTVIAEEPVFRKVKFKYPGKHKVEKALDELSMAQELLDAQRREDEKRSPFDLMLHQKELADHYNWYVRELKKLRNKAEKLSDAHKKGEMKKYGILEKGGQILKIIPDKEEVMPNPRKKKRRKSIYSGVVHMKANPKKRSKKARKKKKSKIAKPALATFVGQKKLGKVAKKRLSRKKALHVRVKVNPSAQEIIATYGVAVVGGALYPWFNYGINWVVNKIDGMVGGAIGSNLEKVENTVPGLVAPTLSLATALTIKELDKRMKILDFLGQYKQHAYKTLDTVAILSAAGIGMAVAEKMRMSPVSRGLSGVKFFPAMSGPDFGNITHRNSGADFGGVKYFPKSDGMHGVEFFPEGADGERMYEQEEEETLAESEGLGVVPEGLGVVPEGLGASDADFGLVPEGLMGEGQMG